MVFMSKYSYEFKEKIVQAYLNSNIVYPYLANKYGVSAWNNIKKIENFYLKELRRMRLKDETL